MTNLSVVIITLNEERNISRCLEAVNDIADEIVVVLDKCSDGTKEIAERYTDRLLEGSWDIEGERRNAGIWPRGIAVMFLPPTRI